MGSQEIQREITPSTDLSPEELHRELFGAVDSNLEHVYRMRNERRDKNAVYVETVVTYGAYEEPI